jgi:hypothetical protein
MCTHFLYHTHPLPLSLPTPLFHWCQPMHSHPWVGPVHQPYFCVGYFPDRVLRTICLDWLRTAIQPEHLEVFCSVLQCSGHKQADAFLLPMCNWTFLDDW